MKSKTWGAAPDVAGDEVAPHGTREEAEGAPPAGVDPLGGGVHLEGERLGGDARPEPHPGEEAGGDEPLEGGVGDAPVVAAAHTGGAQRAIEAGDEVAKQLDERHEPHQGEAAGGDKPLDDGIGDAPVGDEALGGDERHAMEDERHEPHVGGEELEQPHGGGDEHEEVGGDKPLEDVDGSAPASRPGGEEAVEVDVALAVPHKGGEVDTVGTNRAQGSSSTRGSRSRA